MLKSISEFFPCQPLETEKPQNQIEPAPLP